MANEQNEQIVRRMFEEGWNQGNLDVFDEVIAEDAPGHDPAFPEDQIGPGDLKEVVQMYRTAFPDLKFTIEDMISDGDMVACRWSTTGTHTGELQGMPPTGKPVTNSGISIDRIENGKVVEGWVQWDNLGLMQQLGVGEPAGAAAG